MNRFTLVALATAAAALAGCALPGHEYAEFRKRAAAEQAVQDQAMASRVLAQPAAVDAALLLGSATMVLVEVPAQGTAGATQARLFANCKTQTLSMDYRRTADWSGISALAAAPQTSSLLQQLCQTPQHNEWRELPADNQADLLQLDQASLSTNGQHRVLWVAIDYGQTRLDDDTTAYDRQLERLEVDCGSRQGSTRVAYRIGNHTLQRPPVAALSSALEPAQRARLVTAICAEPATLAQLATPQARKKLPPTIATPAVPAALLAQLASLPQGHPSASLSHLQLVYDASTPLMAAAKVNAMAMDLYLQPGPAAGLWRVQPVGDLGRDRVSITWRGLVEVASTRRSFGDKTMAQHADLKGLELRGDWEHLPAGASLGYSTRFLTPSGAPNSLKVECTVGQSVAAAQQVPTLQGLARAVTCNEQGGLKSRREYLYLESYDLFVQTADISALIVQNSTLKAAD